MSDIIAINRRLDEIEGLLERLRKVDTGGQPLTWTPTYVGSSTAGVFTYTIQAGYYTRIGRYVFIQARVTISAIGTPPVGTMTINGLPIAPSASGNSHHSVAFGFINQFNYTAAAIELVGRIPPSDPRIILAESFDNAALVAVPAANFTNVACDLSFSGFYLID